jgi:hypothetical protein
MISSAIEAPTGSTGRACLGKATPSATSSIVWSPRVDAAGADHAGRARDRDAQFRSSLAHHSGTAPARARWTVASSRDGAHVDFAVG